MFRRRRRNPQPELADWQLTTTRLVWLSVASALVLLPHVLRIPPWMTLAYVALALWRLGAALYGVRLPSRLVVALLAVLVTVGVWRSFGTVLGRDAGVAMLMFLAGMKLVETRTLRDAYVLCFLGYFLAVTNFLYSQSMLMGAYMFAVVLVTTATLVALNVEDERLAPRARLRTAGVLLLQAIPVMALLFVLFPRIPGPLWGLPKDAHGGVTGLSDSMNPGSISDLGQSDAVAFRVSFDGGRNPPASQLYWRGPVLWDTDGRRWTGDRRLELGVTPPPVTALGPALLYTLTLEAHQQRFLLALDLPVEAPPGARMGADFQIWNDQPVRDRSRYTMRAWPQYRVDALSPGARERALALPVGQHPRSRALAREWREASPTDAAVVERALQHFRQQPFVYTLSPPLLTGDVVDEFLFLSQRGFCEHYAAAFTVLMRAAGIPARVVTGYQGGEPNPLGDYLLVRQRDAHAWAEVWLDGQGWVRVDPTAAVAPIRVEQGMQAALPESVGAGSALGLDADGSVLAAVQQLRQAWDTINNSWNQWVLGYGPARQAELMARLGFGSVDWRWLGIAMLLTVTAILALVTAWLLRRRPTDPVQRAYQHLCRKLARVGLPRRPHEGPRDYVDRVIRARPDLREALSALVEEYVAARYAGTGGDPRTLARAVAGFRA